MGPIWGRQDPGGPHVGPMKLAIWGIVALLQAIFWNAISWNSLLLLLKCSLTNWARNTLFNADPVHRRTYASAGLDVSKHLNRKCQDYVLRVPKYIDISHTTISNFRDVIIRRLANLFVARTPDFDFKEMYSKYETLRYSVLCIVIMDFTYMNVWMYDIRYWKDGLFPIIWIKITFKPLT